MAERCGAAVQRVGDAVFHAGDGTGNGSSAAIQRFGQATLDIGDDVVDGGGSLIQQCGKVFGGTGNRCGDGFRAAGKRAVETILAFGERAEKLCATLGKNRIDLLMRADDRAGNLVGAGAQGVRQFAGARFERAFQHFLASAERGRKSQGLVGEGAVQAIDIGTENATERIRAACNRLVDAGEALHQLAVERTGALIEGAGKLCNMRVKRRVHQADGRLELLFEEARTQIEIHDRIVGRALQALAEGHALLFQRRGELAEHRVERAVDDLLAAADILRQFLRALGECVVEQAGMLVHGLVEHFRAARKSGGMRCEFLDQRISTLIERIGEIVEAQIEFVVERGSRTVQSIQQILCLCCNQRAHGFRRNAGFLKKRCRARVDHRSERLTTGGKTHGKLFANQ